MAETSRGLGAPLISPFQGDCKISGTESTSSPAVHSGSHNESSPSHDLHTLVPSNTYFLSASSGSWSVIDKERSLYSLRFPLSAVAEWIPIVATRLEGTRHSATPTVRFLSDWIVLEQAAKTYGPDFYSSAIHIVKSALRDDWQPRTTISNLIETGQAPPRYKSSTTFRLEFSGVPFAALGDVMDIRMAEGELNVRFFCRAPISVLSGLLMCYYFYN